MTRNHACNWTMALLAPCLWASAAQAAVVWNESVSGDLANVGTSPTFVALASGSNTIFGSTGNPGTGVDRDYFTVTVPAGQVLQSITVLPGTTVLGGGGLSFIGLQAGTQVTVPVGGPATGLLGWAHYNLADINNNILPRMGTGFGALGFTGPLGAGNYAFWVQETGAGTANYGFDITLAAVPEPAPALLLVAGLLALRWRRRAAQVR